MERGARRKRGAQLQAAAAAQQAAGPKPPVDAVTKPINAAEAVTEPALPPPAIEPQDSPTASEMERAAGLRSTSEGDEWVEEGEELEDDEGEEKEDGEFAGRRALSARALQLRQLTG